MKATVTTGVTSFFCGGVSVAFASPHPLLSNIAAVVGIFAGILTMVQVAASIRKTARETRMVDLETANLIYQRCRNCTSLDDCVFVENARPGLCRHKQAAVPSVPVDEARLKSE